MGDIAKAAKRGIEVKRVDEGNLIANVPDPQVLLDLFGTANEGLASALLVQAGAEASPALSSAVFLMNSRRSMVGSSGAFRWPGCVCCLGQPDQAGLQVDFFDLLTAR